MPPRASHKPRKKQRLHIAFSSPEFPLVAFLWPVRTNASQWLVLPLVLTVAALFRWAVGFWPYSGFQAPPMHGDFEAQRHWMEVTANLPMADWYFHDLQWWGLDYPPLTAYHSWVLGKLGSLINPSWFELYKSRGLDDADLKIYMRATVLASEYLVYVPAVIILLRRLARLEAVHSWEATIALVAVLMQPATMLIDHGHFQYNTVMLGLTVAALSSLLASRFRWACFFFVGALGFKQMALFYAPAMFAYLLGVCISPRIDILRFITIGLTTVLSFAILFAPLLLGAMYDTHRGVEIDGYSPPPLLSRVPFPLDKANIFHTPLIQLAQSIHRIFPFARGLFEDKVANVWCALHTFHKLHVYPTIMVQRAALSATVALIFPPCLILFLKPRKDLILLAFSATAWGFFLCSYQVHEKNDLLPLLPMTLLLATQGGLLPYLRAWVGFANMLGCWTLFPLLKRDGLQIPYFVITLLWAYLLGLPPTSLVAYRNAHSRTAQGVITTLIHAPFYVAMIAWHVAYAFVPPPAGKPDLWIVANVLIGAGGFAVCYMWCLYSLVEKAGWLGHVDSEKEKKQ